MSQNISAFAVYNAGKKRGSAAAKKKNNAKNARVAGKSKAATKNVPKGKKATNAKQTKPNGASKQNTKKKSNGIKNSNQDNLVERLMSNSKSNKLTKEELQRKKILQDCYQKEQKMSDSEEETTDGSSFSSDFSSEYTLNSYTDDTDDSDDTDSDASEYDEEEVIGAESFSLEAIGVEKTTPNKRKNNDNSNNRLEVNGGEVFSLEAIGVQKTTPNKRKNNDNGNDRLEVNGSEVFSLEAIGVQKTTPNKRKNNDNGNDSLEVNGSEVFSLEAIGVQKKNTSKNDESANLRIEFTGEETFRLEALGIPKRSPNKRKNDATESTSVSQKQTKTTPNTVAANGVQTSNNSKRDSVTAARRKSIATTTVKANAKNTAAATKNRRQSLNLPTTASKATNKSPTTKAEVISNTVKLEGLSPPSNINKISSIDEGFRMFRWMLNPIDGKEFFSKYWEKNCCLIKREQTNYYSHLISFEAIDKMLLNNHLEFTKNIDITSYKKGVRETLNPEGRALPPIVWDQYGQGCSIRILNPQTFLEPIYTMNTTLQEYFHCMVGANVYLTPPNSQGFAPHYDDIEAFVLQVEGRKRWRLYKPRNQAEVLPRVSSTNFKQLEIGKPILDEVLKPGDMLYFPRGTIHQACTEPGFHSLHITVSVYQKQSFADLFEHMLPQILRRAVATDVNLRQGLPLDIWRQSGIAFSATDTKERANIIDKISKLLAKTLKSVNLPEVVDAAVDEMAKRFQHEALPPHLMLSERLRTVFGSRSIVNEQGECICDYEFDLRTNIRLLRAHILRLVREKDDKICLYFYAHNSKEYQEFEPNFIEINAEEASCVEVLIRSYPAYIGVSELPVTDENQKICFAQALWERGLLMLEKPLS